MAKITISQFNGREAYLITCGQTDYLYVFSADGGNMAKVIAVVIDNVQIPVHYEISDVVEDVTSYALGIDEDNFTGIFVCIGKRMKTVDFKERVVAIITAINDAIETAIDHNCFSHEWDKATTAEIASLADDMASHFYTVNMGVRTSSTARNSGKPNNPRYPHVCTITHFENNDPMEDQQVVIDDPMFDELMNDYNGDSGDDESGNDNSSYVVYDGICRSGAKNTTSDAGDVITSTRRISIPLTLNDWDRREYKPMVGDVVKVYKAGVVYETGQVLNFQPGNLGTTILFKFVA